MNQESKHSGVNRNHRHKERYQVPCNYSEEYKQYIIGLIVTSENENNQV